jgi:hypothetical protein
MIETMSDEDVYLTARIMEGFEIGLDEWSAGHRGRIELVEPARKTIRRFIARAARKADGRSGDRSSRLPPIEVSRPGSARSWPRSTGAGSPRSASPIAVESGLAGEGEGVGRGSIGWSATGCSCERPSSAG